MNPDRAEISRNLGREYTQAITLSVPNSTMHPFIWCITIKPVALYIIKNTWSLETLSSLHSMVSTEGNHRACEKEEILKKITEQIKEATDLAETILITHSADPLVLDWPEEPCHLCREGSSHNVDHYSTHITTGEFKDESFQDLLGEYQGIARYGCEACKLHYMM